MRLRKIRVLMALAGLALGGCAANGPHSDTQSFLGINQDIRSVFEAGNDYLDPLRLNE
jgi:hypothetical protein